ncbi:MAG: hypothetical protein FWE72_04390, partial [Spirochaetaceae bacterium]|nr:hypothetical protein [Spirochaetaceae bacterium]
MNKIPERKDIKESDKWKLDSIFKSEEEWEKKLVEFNKLIDEAAKYKNTLASSPDNLAECLEYLNKLDMTEERLGSYAQLKYSEDSSDNKNQERMARYMTAATKGEAETSFITPEITSIPDKIITKFLEHERIKPFH